MRFWIFIVLFLFTTGCRTHLVLRNHTIKTAATIADLNYQQVLDNVARYETTPSALPSIAVVNNGTVTVTDQSTLGGAGTYSPTITAADQLGGFPIFNLFMSPNLSRGLTENWTLVPVTDVAKIRRMRWAFQLLVCNGLPPDECEDGMAELDDFFSTDPDKLLYSIPQHWYCVGCKSDVPKNACFVGSYGEKYIWVQPSGMDGLSRFTLTILKLATAEISTENKTIVRKYDANDELEGTEITTIESDVSTKEVKHSRGEDDDAPTSPPVARAKLPNAHRSSPLTPKQLRKRPSTGHPHTLKL